MNTIKFAPYNEFTTEQHNLELAKSICKRINNTDYEFYEPCNLNISVTNACQNSCFFCLNKNRQDNCSDEMYYTNLKKSLILLQEIDCEFTLTGGEPTLNAEKFVKTCKILKEHGLAERTISTTGIGLFSLYEGKPLIQHLADFGFTHNISVSRMSFNESKNLSILKGRNISNDDLEKIAYFSKINNIELRVSTNIIKGSIDDASKVLEALDDFYTLGINTVLFREMVGVDGSLTLDEIRDRLKSDRHFIYDKTISGEFYFVDIFLYESKNMKYIVKFYQNRVPQRKIISSLSYNSGILRCGFNGEILLT